MKTKTQQINRVRLFNLHDGSESYFPEHFADIIVKQQKGAFIRAEEAIRLKIEAEYISNMTKTDSKDYLAKKYKVDLSKIDFSKEAIEGQIKEEAINKLKKMALENLIK